jgi:hypothetical protein
MFLTKWIYETDVSVGHNCNKSVLYKYFKDAMSIGCVPRPHMLVLSVGFC